MTSHNVLRRSSNISQVGSSLSWLDLWCLHDISCSWQQVSFCSLSDCSLPFDCSVQTDPQLWSSFPSSFLFIFSLSSLFACTPRSLLLPFFSVCLLYLCKSSSAHLCSFPSPPVLRSINSVSAMLFLDPASCHGLVCISNELFNSVSYLVWRHSCSWMFCNHRCATHTCTQMCKENGMEGLYIHGSLAIKQVRQEMGTLLSSLVQIFIL